MSKPGYKPWFRKEIPPESLVNMLVPQRNRAMHRGFRQSEPFDALYPRIQVRTERSAQLMERKFI
jgi:hypothetical protein